MQSKKRAWIVRIAAFAFTLLLLGCGEVSVTPPSSPEGLTVTATTKNTISLTWNAVTGATSYRLYRDTSADGSFATEVYHGHADSYTDTGLASDTLYYYKVASENTGGTGPLSAAVSGRTLPFTPDAPGGLTVGTVTSTTVALSWNETAQATGYEAYRDTSPTGSFATLVYSGPATSCTDTGLTPATTYYYRVRGVNANGNGDLSDAVSCRTESGVPPAPTGLAVVSPNAWTLVVSWNAASEALGYELYRDASETGVFDLKVYDGTGTSYTDNDPSLQRDTEYWYKVLAKNNSGKGALSEAASGRTLTGLPAVPTGVRVTGVSDTSITVSWDAADQAESYELYRDIDSGGANRIMVHEGPELTWTDTGLATATVYWYWVKAKNRYATSDYSTPVFYLTGNVPVTIDLS
jgi:fibronectin type 3 domain-containing protein